MQVVNNIPMSTAGSAAGSAVHQPVYIIPRQINLDVKTIRTLGILQIIIGCLSVLFGFLVIFLTSFSHEFPAKYTGFGIWSGVWIIIGGGLGVGSAQNPTNSCLNGVHMAFNIVSCCVSCTSFAFCIILVVVSDNGYYDYYGYDYVRVRDTSGIGLYTMLLLCMLAEFIIALTASIYCCKANYCCQPGAQGMIVQQPDIQHHIVTQNSVAYSSTGQVQLSYPPSHQPTSTAYYPHQGQFISSDRNVQAPASTVQAPAPTSVTYAQSMPPANLPGTDTTAMIQDELQPSFKFNKL